MSNVRLSQQALNASNVPCFHVVCCWCPAPWAPWASSGRPFMVMVNRFFRWMIFRGKTLWVYLRHSFFEGLRANVSSVWWMEGQKGCFVSGKYVRWIWKGEIRFALRNLGSCPPAPSTATKYWPFDFIRTSLREALHDARFFWLRKSSLLSTVCF